MDEQFDIWVDFNSQDDTGLPWTLRREAADPTRIVPGAYVVAGNTHATAVAEVIDVSEDGVVHLRPLPGPVSEYRHLLTTSVQ